MRSRRVRQIKVSADELLHRFEEAGGRVYHFKGRRRCYATTVRVGGWRIGSYGPLTAFSPLSVLYRNASP